MQQEPHDDVEFTPDPTGDSGDADVDLEVAEGALSDKIKKLRQDLKKCQEEKSEYLAGWQRAKADFVNRERLAKEDAKMLGVHIVAKFMHDLFPVLDGFDMAKLSPDWQKADPSWKAGMEAVHKQLLGALAKNNILPFDPSGQPFDPSKHEAVSTMPVTDASQDQVVQTVLQKGYLADDRVIRAARVVIGEYHTPPGSK